MSMIINDKRQKYYGEIKSRFYLRRSTASGPRKIYFVAFIEGKQYRYSTGVRVYPNQWNSKKELAVVSNTLSKQDNQNNMIANERLARFRRYFAEFIEYLCENDVTDIVATLKQFIYQDVAKANFDPYATILDALYHYHNYVKPSIKDSTKRQSESLLSEFARFVDTLPEKDKTMEIFSQSGLNMYKEYLINKMNKSKTGATKRNFGVGQLNRCGAIIALLINKVLVPKEEVSNPVVWIKVEDPRREDQVGHIPLLDDEVTAIENCTGLTPVEEEYRDVFLLHLECGQRVSDLAKLLTGNYKVKQGKKYKYIVVSTMKENIKAIIPLTPRMTMLMERIKSQKLVDPVEFEEKTRGKGNNTYNEAIRRIAKKAGLDREIVKIDSTQKEVRKPLYKTVSSHDARCTFITNMIRKGVSPERLCRMTGHANDEMIKRVYAQLTVEDEINRIESDLYSDVDDNGSDLPVDAPFQKPTEIKSVIQEETTTISKHLDSEPTSLLNSHKFLAYSDYIKGLNDCVDAAINDTDFLPPDCDEESIINYIQEEQEAIKSDFEQTLLDTDEKIFELWKEQDANFKEETCTNPDCSEIVMGIRRLVYLSSLINYLKDNHIGEDAVEYLEGRFYAISEENTDAFHAYHLLSKMNVIMPISRYYLVFAKTLFYIHDYRPIADAFMADEKVIDLKVIPNWDIVFRELQMTPAAWLEMIISKTNCRTDIKRVLYDSVTKGDYNSFISAIQSYEQDAYLLIQHAYSNYYCREIKNMADNIFTTVEKGTMTPWETVESYNELLLLQNPFVDAIFDEETLQYFNKDFRNADVFEESMLQILDFIIKICNEYKQVVYPQEKRVFDKILRFIEMNQSPELKEAYDDYKTKQKTVSSPTDIEVKNVSEEDKVENRKKASSRVNYLPVSIQNLDIDKFIRLLTEKDKLNKYRQFITVQESTDNINVATCLKHFLGTTSLTPLSFRLKWNGHTKVSLKFLIRLITNTNEEASRTNVIDESNREGISPEYVSQWTGSGELWTPVCNVFGGSTGYMMSVGLGKEGSKARKINLEQYNTIADIYFACKK